MHDSFDAQGNLMSTASAASQAGKIGVATPSPGSDAKELLNGDSPDATMLIASGAVGGLSSSRGSQASDRQGVDISAGLVGERIERWLNERTKDE
ncbi:hypothetical protein [Stenotrophomonas sp. Ker107b]